MKQFMNKPYSPACDRNGTPILEALQLHFADRRHVLEIGAGDGSVSDRLLALGCDVTGTEMSLDSVESMNSRFDGNDRFHAVYDPDGSLKVVLEWAWGRSAAGAG